MVKKKLQDENISLKTEVNKRRNVGDHFISLRKIILVEQEILNDVKVECFVEVQKMSDIIKSLEKNIHISNLLEYGFLVDKDWGNKWMEKYGEECSSLSSDYQILWYQITHFGHQWMPRHCFKFWIKRQA